MNKKVNIALLVALSVVLTYCSSSKKDAEKAAEKKQELEEFIEEQFEYPIPTSFEVTKMLQDANASYDAAVTNDPASVDKYETEWQKALNLGVYGADLSFASTFDKKEESVAFLEASKKLIDELNISTAFNKSLASRIESNLENKDSLILIITESFYQTYNYLNQSGDEKTSLLVVSGSVIEGLYITSELIKASDYNADLMQVLAAQKDQVQKLTALMEKHADDANVNKVLPTLRFVGLFYDQLGESNEISQGQFEDVANSIAEMRSEIVG
ncbi:hypothetical protein [Marinoscillum pacificum]|uniref:hypothetical protein n=1 Tax=Marinoscillum pacificum TaxID=392723 RepID=UPI0021584E8D|nr:hypothetical protein [Marinoscillum pacificum]